MLKDTKDHDDKLNNISSSVYRFVLVLFSCFSLAGKVLVLFFFFFSFVFFKIIKPILFT